MKKKTLVEGPIKENGLATIKEIAESERHHVVEILLNDGDKIAITPEIAQGILLILMKLKNPDNKARMEKMELLELLHIYDKAVEDKVLIPSKLLLHPDTKGGRNEH